MDQDAIASYRTRWLLDRHERGIPESDTTSLGFWYHTHPRMEPFMSPTDERTIRKKMPLLSPVVVAVVMNEKGDAGWRFLEDQIETMWASEIPPQIEPPTHAELTKAAAMLSAYVTKSRPRWDLDSYLPWRRRYEQTRPIYPLCPEDQCRWGPDHIGCATAGHEPRRPRRPYA